jgi:RNA polymerase sigma-70 factor (ECF subfamily)
MPDPEELQEAALIQAAVHDPDAFQALYQRYLRRVYAYVAARVGNPQDAEDVVSEIFLRVIRHLDRLHKPQQTSFAAWLFVIARHAVTDHYRRNGQAARLIPLGSAEHLPQPGAQPDALLSEADETARLGQMIALLPERKREIITLRYYAGLRNHEIAAVLGIGEKTVSATLSRALNDLHAHYQTFEATDEQRWNRDV